MFVKYKNLYKALGAVSFVLLVVDSEAQYIVGQILWRLQTDP